MKPLFLAILFSLALPGLCRAKNVAGALVTSQEWRVKRGTNTVEEFKGDVRYHANKNKIYSDRAVFDHKSQNWFLKGHVQAVRTEDSGEILQAFGDNGAYNQDSQKGWLRPASKRGQIQMIRRPVTGLPDHATSDWARWKGDSQTILIGHVHSQGPQMESWSDQTTVLEDPSPKPGCSLRHVVLTGSRPVALKFPQDKKDYQGAVKADVLKMRNPHPVNQESSETSNPTTCGEDRFVAVGHARGWIIFHNTEKKSKSKKKKKK